jgi:hypothetical protein
MIDDCENTILVESRGNARLDVNSGVEGCCSHYQFSLKKDILKGR